MRCLVFVAAAAPSGAVRLVTRRWTGRRSLSRPGRSPEQNTAAAQLFSREAAQVTWRFWRKLLRRRFASVHQSQRLWLLGRAILRERDQPPIAQAKGALLVESSMRASVLLDASCHRARSRRAARGHAPILRRSVVARLLLVARVQSFVQPYASHAIHAKPAEFYAQSPCVALALFITTTTRAQPQLWRDLKSATSAWREADPTSEAGGQAKSPRKPQLPHLTYKHELDYAPPRLCGFRAQRCTARSSRVLDFSDSFTAWPIRRSAPPWANAFKTERQRNRWKGDHPTG